MPLTRGCPRPRPVWIAGEQRVATARHTIPRATLLGVWHLAKATCLSGVEHPEGHLFRLLDDAACELPGQPRLISARHGAELLATLSGVPCSERLCAAVVSRVYDTWNAARYPCYTSTLRCYLAGGDGNVVWHNSTDIAHVRRQLREHAATRHAASERGTAFYLRMAI